ncbi:hypothetical protein [Levilactobacillus mulengensis]|uniref:hypothetical protein n=1 Tax=Levilactobacillus mulengensis TaxID=2486025 RepID=UPI000F7A564E|nr:hypothetical protein [Levilactobacillus mulengensis]
MLFILYILVGFFCYWFGKNELNTKGKVLWGATLGIPFLVAFLWVGLGFKTLILVIVAVLIVFQVRDGLSASSNRASWKRIDSIIETPYEFVEALGQKVESSGRGSDIKIMPDDLPYNRIRAFIHGTSLDSNNSGVFPIVYNAQPADNEMAFLEYGYTVLTAGIVIKYQVEDKTEVTDSKQKKYRAKTEIIYFQNLYYVLRKGSKLILWYENNNGKQKRTLSSEELAAHLEYILMTVIQLGWTHNVSQVLNRFSAEDNNELDMIVDETNQEADRIMAIKNAAESANKAYEYKQFQKNMTRFRTGAFNLNQTLSKEIILNQVADRFGGGQGHGHAGEQAGHANDALKLKKAVRWGGTHEKGGADRVVNGQKIQTKYYTTARGSVDAFIKGDYASRGEILECPKDQYNQAIKLMGKKIEQGKVSGETNPQNAANYVKCGALTYEQAEIATKSIFDRHSTIAVRGDNNKVVRDSNGKIETRSVTFGEKLAYSVGTDLKAGAAAALPMATVTAVWTFTVAEWNGADMKTALKMSLLGFAKPMLFGAGVYAFSSQFAGSNMGKKLAINLWGSRSSKELAKVGKLAGGTVVAVISYGPDTIDFLRGRISMNQLTKNISVTTTGMVVGSVLGSSLGPIGAVVGGAVGSYTSKKLLDQFSEDDSKKMIRVAKEEFIENVVSMPLSMDEFQEITTIVFLDKKSTGLYKEMYASGEARKYIDDVLQKLVADKFKSRDLPEDDIVSMVQSADEKFAGYAW